MDAGRAALVLAASCVALSGCASTRYAKMPDGDDGVVDLECTVNPDGSVSGCVILSERPLGVGVGDMALEAARTARLSPRSVNGVATGGTVRFTVTIPIENGVMVRGQNLPDPRS